MSIIERFNRVYLGDECIRQITLDITEYTCNLALSGASIHKRPIKAFEYEMVYQPALLKFSGVKTVNIPDYCLNFEIVDYEVKELQAHGYYRFSLTMTGGWDNDTFMRTIEIVAKDFSLGGEIAAPPQAE